MKKMYVKPEIEIIQFESEIYMFTSSDLEGTETGGDKEGGSADANRHRGEWGNLWAED
jgi:hypothetical protein